MPRRFAFGPRYTALRSTLDLTAEFADWDDKARQVDAALPCPYCGKENRAGFPARLLWVAKPATECRSLRH